MSGATKLTPAQIRKSITDAGIVSFEDGKTYKTLKRTLAIRGLTPDAYRAKWGLPANYPIVAPSYRAARSAIAKQFGLGNKGRDAPAPAAVSGPLPPAVAAPKADRGSKATSATPVPAPALDTPPAAVAARKAPRKARPSKALSPSEDGFT